MTIKKAVLIPTGTEIIDGTVLDTNSPAIMYSLISLYPRCIVHRDMPVADNLNKICDAVLSWVEKGVDLVIIIGGSGGGHRFSSTLSEDHTHSALESLLDENVSREIWGKNGHLWCKLVCGKKNDTLVINVPGPHVEAKAAIEAFCEAYKINPNGLDEINIKMIKAVLSQYPDRDE
jgi:molybdopterin biosynthesis enzyme